MEAVAGEFAALSETVVFLNHFKDLPDPRQPGKIVYPLAEVLLLCLLAVLGGAETFVDIARFGEKKIDLLRRFRPFRDGTPSHDHLGDIFATLDAEAFQRCFVSWVAALTAQVHYEEFDGEQTTVDAMISRDDGKTWSAPRAVARTTDASDHPLLVTDGRRVFLSWMTRADGYRLLPLEDAP